MKSCLSQGFQNPIEIYLFLFSNTILSLDLLERLRQEDVMEVKFYPLTKHRWTDFEQLFGERGACGGCWCMVPGLLAYAKGKPLAWCSVAPRENFPVLDRSQILKKVDDEPVWSVVCFFVEKNHRNKGLTGQLLKAAIDYVRQQGGKILEGYPVEPKKDRYPAAFAWTGFASAFNKLEFVECVRRSETRPIMRFYLSED
jgi:GNAT superfamily N-acetyltransferase